jgi:hypothetical protein
VDLFQTRFFSEYLEAPGIEPGTSESVARKSDHRGGPITNNTTEFNVISITHPTSSSCKHVRTELTSRFNDDESLKSAEKFFLLGYNAV